MNSLKEKLLKTGLFEDSEYLDEYLLLIANNLKTQKRNGATNKHHILPASYFRLLKEPVDNSPDNLVNLSLKDHVFAHYYLCKCITTSSKLYYNMLCALSRLLYGTAFINIDLKEVFNELERVDWEKISGELKKRNILLKEKMLGNQHAKGNILSLDVRQQMSRSRLGHNTSLETKEKISQKSLHKHWVNKGGIYTRVREDVIDNYLNDGWVIGGRPCSEEHKNKISLKNLGSKRSEETKLKMSQKAKGRIPWNKGKPMSEETKKKLSEKLKGKYGNRKGCKHSEEAKEKNRLAHLGRIPWNKGLKKTATKS